MAELGTYYITIMPEMSKFTGEVKSAMSGAGTQGGQQYATSFGDIIKGSAIGVALGNLASRAGSAIMDGLQTGIGRLDTLENFPRVMESLGYKSDDAAAAIQRIRGRLDGLPTATQDVVSLTQAIADSTGDLGLATDAALGFNDMLLASGASTGEVTQAQGVFNRILGKGNATVAQWQSLQSVMPAQLSAVAREMLGAGASTEDLREALNNGEVSWNDFLAAIVKLDNEGSGSMSSFYDQARANSVGIGTAIQNVGNRIGDGWATIMQKIGQQNISGAIDKMSYGVRDAMHRVADAVGYVVDKIGQTNIVKNIGEVGKTIGEALKAIWEDGGPEMLKGVTDALIELIDKVLQWLVDHKDVVKVAIGGIVGAIAALVGLQLAQWLMGIPAAISAISTAMMANPIGLIATAIGIVVMALYTFFTQTETGKAIVQGFLDVISWLGDKLGWLVTAIGEWLSSLPAKFEEFKENLTTWWTGVVEFWSTQWEEFKTIPGKTWDKIKEDASAAWEAINTWLTEKLEAISTGFVEWGDKVCSDVANAWENLKADVADKWEAIKRIFFGVVEMVTDKVIHFVADIVKWWGKLYEDTRAKWEEMKQKVIDIATSLRDGAVEKWNNLKARVSEIVDNIKSSIREKFTAAKNTVLGIFDDIKNGIKEKMDWVHDKISAIIDKIKGLFDFSWSFPDLSLPHISWDWVDVGGLVSIPEFSVSWYAKGGVFDKASVIGIGESGREAALPLNQQTYREIAKGIAAEGDTQKNGPTVLVTGNEFYVRDEYDIDLIAERLARKVSREEAALV